jgi:CheY-like chemotaxis protein
MSLLGPIILVDDDEDDRNFSVAALERLKMPNKVHCFMNGKEALEYLLSTSESPFMIFCDIDMPVMNGLQFRHEINKNEHLRKKSIPFIFLSGSATRQAVEIAYEMTVQGFFEKTLSFEELQKQMKLVTDYWKTCMHPNAIT